MNKQEQVEYQLYEVVKEVTVHSDSGEIIGSLQVGERVYARADTLKTTKTYDRDLMEEDIVKEIRHAKGWSVLAYATNGRDDGYKEQPNMKLVDTVYGSPDEYPSLPETD